ncbi:Levanase [Orchesella cincta]|uniref:Levanase n=1 Tax=Orchesella cincta TaxID=48709 RepID=A0A1D2NHW9_ORCCI|nr:Levanase [Orchesella cincta]WEI57534.1 putative GH32 family protein [Orchesella cincta]
MAFGTMGEVSRTSNDTLYKIKRSIASHSKRDKLSRRVLRSMPPVRMALGSVSYFDELFAASNIDFVIRQTSLKFIAIGLVALVAIHVTESKSVFHTEQNQCTTEQYRLRYHFSPAEHWINDPNGMVYYDGVYHLFFQYHPYSTVWGPMHWGHAISRDLATWEELPVALAPDEIGDIFSGSSVVDFTNSSGFQTSPDIAPIVAIYTSAGGAGQRQSIAYSNDKATTFTKFEGNPVLSDANSPDFRDPKVRKLSNGKWAMALAVRNKIEFYGSDDLKSWNKLSEFGADPEQGSHGGVWECPDLFPLNVTQVDGTTLEMWVLIVSINPGGPNRGSAAHYFVGTFDGTFTALPWQNTQWLDWGPDNYAAVTFSNEPQDRFIAMGWMNNWMYANNLPTAAWRGQMTIPRTLGLRDLNKSENRYRLTSVPTAELEALRNPQEYVGNNAEFMVPPQTVIQLTEQATFKNPAMELEITLEISQQPRFSLCAHNSGGEEICFGLNETRWYQDRSKTGNTGFNGEYAATLYASAPREIDDQEMKIRIFLDVSSFEVFADDGLTSMTSLFYTNEPLDMFYVNHWSDTGSSATVKVKNFKVWGLVCWFQERAQKLKLS